MAPEIPDVIGQTAESFLSVEKNEKYVLRTTDLTSWFQPANEH